MFNSWFHVCYWAQYLDQELSQVALGRPFTYRKGELYIPLQGHTKLQSIHFLLSAPLPYFMVEDNLPQPRERVPVLTTLAGQRIAQVRIHGNDRQLLICFTGQQTYLLLQLFGINGNAFHLDTHFNVQAAFKSARKQRLPRFRDFIKPAEAIPLGQEQIASALREYPQQTIKNVLKKLPTPIYPRTLQTEIEQRTDLAISQHVISLNQDQQARLVKTIETLLAEMQKPVFLVYHTTPPVLAFIFLQSLESDYEACADVRTASWRYIRIFFRNYQFTRKKKHLQQHLSQYINRLERKLKRQQTDYQGLSSAKDYQKQADTLLANLQRIEKGARQVSLPRVDNPDELLEIELNPRLTPAQNAEKRYKKARRIRSSKAELTSTIQETKQELAELKQTQAMLQRADDWAALKKIEKALPQSIFQYPRTPRDYERLPYHLFYYQGWEILVGKGARDNDRLTFKVAKPIDFWLHAQQVPGSHVVVRNPEKKQSLPQAVLVHAAALAAGYSQAKHAGLVPVVYTMKKYVWKRKSMPPGRVFMKYEKTVFAEPLRPSKEDQQA